MLPTTFLGIATKAYRHASETKRRCAPGTKVVTAEDDEGDEAKVDDEKKAAGLGGGGEGGGGDGDRGQRAWTRRVARR